MLAGELPLHKACVAIFLQRVSDETNRICRSHTSTHTAKLMVGKLSFAILAEQAAVPHVIQGAVPTRRFFDAAELVDIICGAFSVGERVALD